MAKSRVESCSTYCKVNVDSIPLDKWMHWRMIGLLNKKEVATKELNILNCHAYKEPLNTAATDVSPG